MTKTDGGIGKEIPEKVATAPKRQHPDLVKKFRLHKTSSFSYFHVVVFVLTFLAYTVVRANRKSFSNVKVLVAEEWTPSKERGDGQKRIMSPDEIWNARTFFDGSHDAFVKTFMGSLNTCFLVAYAVGLYVGGIIGDRVNLRYFLCGCMIANSFIIFLFACIPLWSDFYSIIFYIALWIINGLLQGTAWPCVLAIMANWFGPKARGLIFGIWSANASVGSIVGSLMVAQIVDYGYEIAMLIPAVIMVAISVVILSGMVASPVELGLTAESFVFAKPNSKDSDKDASVAIGEEEKPEEQPEEATNGRVSFLEALLIPGVIIYSLAYACLKLVNYAFFFWLPYYLNQQFHWSQAVADNLSTMYDWGGVFGGILGGLASDRLVSGRSPVLLGMLLLAIPSLVIYIKLPADLIINGVGLTFCGFFISGVANILSGVVAADLGKHPKLSGNRSAFATVSGIVDGTGSAGAAIGQFFIPLIEKHFGWDAVFYMLIGCTCLTILCILPVCVKEVRNNKETRELVTKFCCFCCRNDQSPKSTEAGAVMQPLNPNAVFGKGQGDDITDEVL